MCARHSNRNVHPVYHARSLRYGIYTIVYSMYLVFTVCYMLYVLLCALARLLFTTLCLCSRACGFFWLTDAVRYRVAFARPVRQWRIHVELRSMRVKCAQNIDSSAYANEPMENHFSRTKNVKRTCSFAECCGITAQHRPHVRFAIARWQCWGKSRKRPAIGYVSSLCVRVRVA